MSKYQIIEKGSKFSSSYATYFYDKSTSSIVSPFHDIPLFYNKESYLINMVVEIPRWTNAKHEIDCKAELNPIKQDIKKGKPRFVHNLFPFHGYPWNYGAIPQTWEDPEYVDPHTQAKGDNDPLDVIDIGSPLTKTGDVIPMKVVGCIALIDEGETDWKIIAINTEDPRHEKVDSLETLNEHFPGVLHSTVLWFRYYKVPAGSGPNKFAFEGEYFKDRDFTMKIIDEAHKSWKGLVSRESKGVSLLTTTHSSHRHFVDGEKARAIVGHAEALPLSPIPEEVHKLYHVLME